MLWPVKGGGLSRSRESFTLMFVDVNDPRCFLPNGFFLLFAFLAEDGIV